MAIEKRMNKKFQIERTFKVMRELYFNKSLFDKIPNTNNSEWAEEEMNSRYDPYIMDVIKSPGHCKYFTNFTYEQLVEIEKYCTCVCEYNEQTGWIEVGRKNILHIFSKNQKVSVFFRFFFLYYFVKPNPSFVEAFNRMKLDRFIVSKNEFINRDTAVGSTKRFLQESIQLFENVVDKRRSPEPKN